MTSHRLASLGTAALLALTPMSGRAAPMPATIPPAAFARQAQTQAATLRQHWLATGHPVPAASSAPFIVAGTILTPQVSVTEAPGAAGVSVAYKAANGLRQIVLDFQSATTTQVLSVTYFGDSGLTPSTQGTVTIQEANQTGGGAQYPLMSSTALSLYAAPGTWNLTYVSIFDTTGEYNSYSGSQIAGIFRQTSFQAINTASPDIAPPTASAGLILTPVVSLSSATPLFRAGLTVADPVSGVASAFIQLTATSGFGGFYASSNSLVPPVQAGSVTVSSLLNSQFTPAGTYQISSYELCDFAGNCITDTSPADIKALFPVTTVRLVQ